MDLEKLMELITEEDVISILTDFGSSYPILDNQGNLLFDTIVSHGGDSKHKLCYFLDSKKFYCYSRSYGTSLIDIIMFNLNTDFSSAFTWLKRFKGISSSAYGRVGFGVSKETNEDLDFLTSYDFKAYNQDVVLKTYNEDVLSIFHDMYPASWKKEGITPPVATLFDLKFCLIRNACIIPYRNLEGKLIGIRQRNFDTNQIHAGRKYIPATIEGTTYSYPVLQTFYGLYEHQDNIRKYKKAVLFESEKSVLLHSSYYENSVALGLGGSAFSKKQRQILADLGVEEVVICLDKDYDEERLKDKTSNDYRVFVGMVKKLKKMVAILSPYLSVSVVLCFDKRLDLKDSPIDKGKAVYESLYASKHVVCDADELDILLD